jgi:hypothetical protein
MVPQGLLLQDNNCENNSAFMSQVTGLLRSVIKPNQSS